MRRPDNFIPIIGAIISAVAGSVNSGLQGISGKIGSMSAEAAEKLAVNDAVNEELMAGMKPVKSNSTFYIIFGVSMLLIIIIAIIIIKRRKK